MHVRQNDVLSRFLRRMEEQLHELVDAENTRFIRGFGRGTGQNLLENALSDEDVRTVSIPDDGWSGTGPLEAYVESFDNCGEISGFERDPWPFQDWPEVLA